MVYTLGQAAKAVGKSKTAVANAVKKGHLSAFKDAFGQWQIDPAELHRVYPTNGAALGAVAQQNDGHGTGEIERFKATVEGLERLCRQITDERDNLRGHIDRLSDQNTRLTAILSAPQPATAKSAWWKFGKAT